MANLRFVGSVLAITTGGCDADRTPMFETGNDTGGVDSGLTDSAADSGDSGDVVVEPSWTWEGHIAVEVTAEGYSACAISDQGWIECWGTDANLTGLNAPPGELLHGVAVSEYHACGITESGAAQCWGCEFQRSDGSVRSADYGQCQPPNLQFLKLEANATTSCALAIDNSVWCWGGSADGQPNPLQIASDVGDFSMGTVNCTITLSGTLSCTQSQSMPEPPSVADPIRVESSELEACVQGTDSKVSCWGFSTYDAELSSEVATDFDAGKYSACQVRATDGSVECVGIPFADYPEPDGTYTRVAVGSGHAYAIRDDGVLVRWGDPTEDVTYDD